MKPREDIVRRSGSYEGIALLAARLSGVKEDAKAVALDPRARQIRDDLVEDYNRQLRDYETWTLKAILSYWADATRGVKMNLTSVHLDRQWALVRSRALKLRAERTREMMELMKKGDFQTGDLLAAGNQFAAQKIFEALDQLPAIAIEELDAAKTLRLISTLSEMTAVNSKASLDAARKAVVDQQAQKFDAEMKRLARLPAGAGLTEDRIAEVRKVVFGT